MRRGVTGGSVWDMVWRAWQEGGKTEIHSRKATRRAWSSLDRNTAVDDCNVSSSSFLSTKRSDSGVARLNWRTDDECAFSIYACVNEGSRDAAAFLMGRLF